MGAWVDIEWHLPNFDLNPRVWDIRVRYRDTGIARRVKGVEHEIRSNIWYIGVDLGKS